MFGGVIKTSSRLAILAAAGIFISGYGPGTASAADLGGDCCADLEERVAELEATTVRKAQRVISLTISGRVHESILYWDDGGARANSNFQDSDFHQVSGLGGTSNMSFDGRARINSDVEALFRLKMQWTHQGGGDISQNGRDLTPADNVEMTEAYWGLRSATLGAVTVGTRGQVHQSAAKVDISGKANYIGDISPSTYGDDLFVRRNTGVLGQVTWGELFNADDGDNSASDRPGVRYDSPSFGGFVVSAGWSEEATNQDVYSVRLNYVGQWGDFRVAGAVAYFDENDEDVGVLTSSGVSGSAGIMHVPTGLFVNAGAGEKDAVSGVATENDPNFWYVTAGIQQSWVSWGKTTIYGTYYSSSDNNADDAVNENFDSNYWGAYINQDIDAAAMRIYLGVRVMESDYISSNSLAGEPNETENEGIEDNLLIGFGAEIRF